MSSEDVERGDGDDGFERFERLGRGLARAAKRELSASCATSSAATKMTCATLVLGCAARKMVIGEKTFDAAFALEAYATTRKPWTLVTSGYVERSFAALVVDCWGLLYIGGILEPVWGAKELTRFVVGVNLATTTLAWLSMCALYALSAGDEFYLFAKFSGFHGVLAALLLALRQTSPEEPVFAGEGALGAGTSGVVASLRALRNKHLIGAYLCFTAAYAFMSGGAHHHVGLYLFDIWGAYSAWVYLRFFQPHGSGARGDDSDDFAFAALFPPAARPVIARVSAPIGAAARALEARRRRAREEADTRAAASTATAKPAQSPAAAAAAAVVRAKLESSSAREEDDDAKSKREARAARGRALVEARANADASP